MLSATTDFKVGNLNNKSWARIYSFNWFHFPFSALLLLDALVLSCMVHLSGSCSSSFQNLLMLYFCGKFMN